MYVCFCISFKKLEKISEKAKQNRRTYHLIKGCSKKVIVVKNTGSNMFEEAYFIINPKEKRLVR